MEVKKIYGVYPGSLSNVNKINNLDEIELFLNLDGMSKFIWKCHQDMAYKKLPEINLTEENYALEYLIYQTTRFGVAISLPEEGKHVSITPDYIDWFTYYTKHFHDNMSEEEWNEFMEARKNGKDVSKYLPEKTWGELHKEKSFVLKK